MVTRSRMEKVHRRLFKRRGKTKCSEESLGSPCSGILCICWWSWYKMQIPSFHCYIYGASDEAYSLNLALSEKLSQPFDNGGDDDKCSTGTNPKFISDAVVASVLAPPKFGVDSKVSSLEVPPMFHNDSVQCDSITPSKIIGDSSWISKTYGTSPDDGDCSATKLRKVAKNDKV